MSYRKLVGTFAEVRLTEKLFPLPNDYLRALREAAESGALFAPSLRRREHLLKPDLFASQWDAYKEEAGENLAFAHLLMACFLMRICEDIRKMRHRSSSERIYSHLLALAQYELTHACLLLNEKNLRYLHTRHQHIEIGEKIWTDKLTGAMTAVRIMRLFLESGARVYLTVPIVDCEWKIDLVVRWQSRYRNLCVQIKTDNEEPNGLGYTCFKQIEAKDLADRDNPYRLFLIGVDRFCERNGGRWTPAEIRLAATLYEFGVVESPEKIREIFKDMLIDINMPNAHQTYAITQT